MANTEKPVRQSVSLPARLARRVRNLARAQRTSVSRVLVDLIESGLAAREEEKRRFFDLAGRLRRSEEPAEQARLRGELARMTFGEGFEQEMRVIAAHAGRVRRRWSAENPA